MARPRGFWGGDEGAEEWGRRNNVDPDTARRRFHKKKKDDSFSQASDDYSVNPETGEIADPDGEIIDNLGE